MLPPALKSGAIAEVPLSAFFERYSSGRGRHRGGHCLIVPGAVDEPLESQII